MKKSNFTIYLLYFLLFAAVASYLGISVYRSVSDPFDTAQAVYYEIEESLSISGIVVRSETQLSSGYDIVDVLVSDGERVSVGQAVAAGYTDESALELNHEAGKLLNRIERLEYAIERGASASEISGSDTAVAGSVYSIVAMVQSGDLSSLYKEAEELKTLVFTREYSSVGAGASAELETLRSQYNSLVSAAGTGSHSIVVQAAGTFSTHADGFESVTPATLETIDAAGLRALESQEGGVAPNCFGKLISGTYWYFASVVPSEDVRSLDTGDTVDIRLSKYLSGTVKMTILRKGADEGGYCVLVLSTSRALQDTTSLRKQTVDIVSSFCSGVRVPKRALHLDDKGGPCVYVVLGAQARRVEVNIIYEGGDYYIVEYDRDNPSALSPGAEVITSAKDLYDGKVVR